MAGSMHSVTSGNRLEGRLKALTESKADNYQSNAGARSVAHGRVNVISVAEWRLPAFETSQSSAWP